MTPREQAALAVAHAEAALLDARKALREAVKAEIAAMLPLPDVQGFDAVLPVVRDALRKNQGARKFSQTAKGREKLAQLRRESWLMEGVGRHGIGVEVIDADVEGDGDVMVVVTHGVTMLSANLSQMPLDAAVKGILTWLADRDVFMEVPT